MRTPLFTAAAAVLLAAVSLVPSIAAAQDTFAAPLGWVPIGGSERNDVAGEGAATAKLAGTTLTITGSFTGLPARATGAKLLKGVAKGARGPAPAEIADLRVSGDTNGTLAGDVQLTPEQVEALKAGQLYVQLYSEKGVQPDHSTLWGWLAGQGGGRR
jgi:hypothetical protein